MEHKAYDELDRIIDRGLAGYAAHEPLAGLEDRVLNRVRLANPAGGAQHASLGLAVPAVAALILVAVLPRSSRAPVADRVPPSRGACRETRAASAGPRRHASPAIRQRVARRPRPLPKRNQFPTPTPLTPEERALIAVAQLPPAGLESVSQYPANPEEIRIEPIEIPPLQIDGNDKESLYAQDDEVEFRTVRARDGGRDLSGPGVEPTKFYKMEFVVKEVEGTKVVNSRAYFMTVPVDAPGRYQAADRFEPAAGCHATTPAAGGFNYIDVGVTSIARSLRELQSDISVYITADISSHSVEPNLPAPVIRQNRWSFNGAGARQEADGSLCLRRHHVQTPDPVGTHRNTPPLSPRGAARVSGSTAAPSPVSIRRRGGNEYLFTPGGSGYNINKSQMSVYLHRGPIELHGWDARARAWHGPTSLRFSSKGCARLIEKLRARPAAGMASFTLTSPESLA